jgi:two-component system, NtrC family, response regulator AtoC
VSGIVKTTLNVLVVDDDPMLGDLLHEVLQISGHQCQVAKTGAAALELLARHPFDLVISDLWMPGLSGMELWERLRADHPELATRMILISAEDPASKRCEFVRSTGLTYLKKPFRIQELSAIVERTFARAQPAA